MYNTKPRLNRYSLINHTCVNIVDDVLEHHRDVQIGSREQRGVSRDVFSNLPEDSRRTRLRRARPEELHAAEPESGDSIVLIAARGGA